MASTTPRRERKVVTVVFCDLVGFTARAESLDPEDVEALLGPYHERVRTELERHGGTVEKFIGDAVMALFGAPIAHEDDPERAVRAALAIRDFALEEGLELRVGITTGEALVRLDARPDAGEGMASGDVVNTAARLQSAAPVNGILVDETTCRATRAAVDYEAAAPVEAKGKAEPIAVWTAAAAHSRFGVDTAHEARSELVGRERELGLVRETFERARHERTPQLLTLVGVPGIGKSRLVYELFTQVIVPDPDLITWRQGRCLAYGDGITLWALGEIVKAQAGVLEQDTPDEIAAKIHQTVSDTLAGTGDEARVEAHLLALLGLGGEGQLGGDRRNEAFAAWRRFLEGLAEQRPLVLVVEDIHWADETLLDFLDELVDWVTDVPLLVVATARPELLERRPGWGGGKLNATTLALSPLSDEYTAALLGKLLGKPVLDADSQRALLERAGGNPLYAEQFVELYVEQGSTDELGLPETLQGIIAARLDGLPEGEKGLLQDAAVVGKVFWASAIGQDPHAAAASLHSLERKGFVRRQRRSSLEGESEFSFAHALVRDVSYNQIPRVDRSQRHRQVAEWIESLGRPEDHAEMLAYHWSSALELVRAAGREDDALVERTRLALREAGDRAAALNAHAAAAAQYEDALALSPNDAERPDLLYRRGRALHLAGDDRGELALEEARVALLAAGAVEAAAEAESLLSRAAWYRGRGGDADDHISRALGLIADRGPSPQKARILAVAARHRMLGGRPEEAIAIANEALVLAGELGLDEIRAHVLSTIGSSKSRLELHAGRADLEAALALSRAIDSPLVANVLNNLAVLAVWNGEFLRARELYREGITVAERFGERDMVRFMRANLLFGVFVLGEWDEALDGADAFIAECAASPHYGEGLVRGARASIRLARGDIAEAVEDRRVALEAARAIQDPQRLLPTLAESVTTFALLDRDDEARALAHEALELARENVDLAAMLNQLVCTAARLGVRAELREILQEAPAGPWEELTLVGLDGDLVQVAEIFAGFQAVTLEAQVRHFAGEMLLAAGDVAEGVAQLERALSFHRSVGATFFVDRAERLLADAYSDSA